MFLGFCLHTGCESSTPLRTESCYIETGGSQSQDGQNASYTASVSSTSADVDQYLTSLGEERVDDVANHLKQQVA
mgnify:CR=1 FL=1